MSHYPKTGSYSRNKIKVDLDQSTYATKSSNQIFGRTPTGLSEERITIPATSDNSFTPRRTYIHNSKIAVKFEGNCLIQDKKIFTHAK